MLDIDSVVVNKNCAEVKLENPLMTLATMNKIVN